MPIMGIQGLSKEALEGRVSALLLATALTFSTPACGKSSEPAAGGAATANTAAASTAAPATTGAAAPGQEGPKPAAPAGGKRIQVAIKDVQIFHPYSADRAMPSVKDDGTVSTRDSRPRYGVGFIVEATNETGEILRDPWFEGSIKLVGEDGQESVCEVIADTVADFTGTRFLSYAPRPPMKLDAITTEGALGPQTDWKDESESLIESVVRPSERIRMLARKNECELPVLGDLSPKSIKGRVVVKARRRFVEAYGYDFDKEGYDMALDGDYVRIRDRRSSRVMVVPSKDVNEMQSVGGAATASPMPLSHVKLRGIVRLTDVDLVESEPVEFDLHPRALTLQLVKLPTGELEHASGNVVIRQKEGKVAYEEMARLKMSLLGVERADVPGATPEVSFEADELSGKVASVSLVYAADEPSLAKGQRKLSVTWKLAIKGDMIEARLRAPLDAATSALQNATQAAEAASNDASAEASVVAKAKADLASAKSAKSAAETKYKTGLGGERGRLAKLFACGDAKLATNKSVRAPSNAKAAGDACKALDKENEVEVTMTYALDRYEVPVAIVYSVGKTGAFRPIASEPLLKIDPR